MEFAIQPPPMETEDAIITGFLVLITAIGYFISSMASEGLFLSLAFLAVFFGKCLRYPKTMTLAQFMKFCSGVDSARKATPEHVKRVLRLVENYWPLEKISMHFHDTYGCALANCQTSLEIGVRSFDSSVSGLGGCPYAPGASGNLSTEDLVYLAHREGYSTGVDLKKLISAGAKIDTYLNRRTSSRVHQAVSQNRC